MSLRLPLLLAAVAFTFLPALAHAAQDARVTVESADVRQAPDPKAPVLGIVKRGKLLRISEKTKNGFHHVRLPDPVPGVEYGWILASQLLPEDLDAQLRAAGIEPGDPKARESHRHLFTLHGFYQFNYVQPKKVQEASGTSGTTIGPAYGAEIGYRITTETTLVAHLSIHSAEQVVAAGSWSVNGTIGMLAVDHTLVHSLPFKVSASLGGGMSFATKLTMVTGGTGIASSDQAIPVAVAKLVARWYLGSQFALVGDAGGRYLAKKALAVGARSVDLNLTAPFFGLGLQFEF